MSEQVLVVATKKGFYHGIRDVGTQFHVPPSLITGKKTWFKPVDEKYAVSDQQSTDPNNPYTRMNKEALSQAAAERGIQLTGAETKAQIIELLTAE
ncbi:hypothetical protein BFR69_04330 [Acinetobacter pittii]|uniref:hypothetical protein n=1 Tax=Acinetobacter calcoaceticus/baumannii complex TaxID=909768 RepID=UPI000450BECC|nr:MULTISPECIES: hypothetical protein [Acinetobacter calcoaceticus/baumannii complex]AUT34460.1 hypothetical protein C2U64_11770 [Acinetobacter pittii]EXG31430.1 hypothetical protein J733_2027 [Acinetobacter sp. 263903-2]KCX62677.1 hypothetical protein J541_1531 [Acinetobacter pittii]KRJ07168.1 hypothetical protein APC76_12695 [Acinetobacter pittii]MCE6395674.1 hypothetical protein [Acinetobacter pittii]